MVAGSLQPAALDSAVAKEHSIGAGEIVYRHDRLVPLQPTMFPAHSCVLQDDVALGAFADGDRGTPGLLLHDPPLLVDNG
jgi:hypothetical protein